jgi:hypothetical protein
VANHRDLQWATPIGVAGLLCVVVGIGIVAWRCFRLEYVGVEALPDGKTQSLMLGQIHWHVEHFRPVDQRHWHDKDQDFSRLATTYYHRSGPLGRVMERFNWAHGPTNTYASDFRMPTALVASAAQPVGMAHLSVLPQLWSEPPIGVVFLQAATVANYGRPCQWIDFYERSPAVIELFDPVSKERRFHTIQNAVDRGVNVRIFPGDELDALARGPKGFYHVLIVEMGRTERTSYIRRHATPQAFAIFSEAITEEGLICFHASSTDDSIAVDVMDVALTEDFHVLEGVDRHRSGDKDRLWSHWLVVARRPQYLRHLTQPHWAMPRFLLDPDPVRFHWLSR